MTSLTEQFLSNPRIWIALGVGIVAILFAFSSQKAFLVVCSCFAVLVSIVYPHTVTEIEHISLWGPLETVRAYNRFLAIIFGASLLLVSLFKSSNLPVISPCAVILIVVHSFIFGKNLFQGYDSFLALTYFAAFVIVLLLFWYAIASGDSCEKIVNNYVIFAMASGVVFFGITAIQFRVNLSAMTRVGDRFHGLTSNPQMFVISFVPFIPVAYYAFAKYKNLLVRAFCVLAILCGLYWCYLTGSRLSLMLICVSFATFAQMRPGTMILIVVFGFMVVCVMSLAEMTPEINSDSRIFTAADTRTEVWQRQLNQFLENPVLGVISPGGRVTFAENSWLGAAASLGLVGLIPMVFLGARCVRLTFLAWRFGGGFPSSNERSLLFSVMLISLVGSCFEAFVYGVLTLPIIFFIATVFTLERVDQLNRFSQRRSSVRHSSQLLPVNSSVAAISSVSIK